MYGANIEVVVMQFISFLHRALNGSLAESPKFVVEFLELLAEEIHPRAQEDFEEMAAAKKSQQGTSRVRTGTFSAMDF